MPKYTEASVYQQKEEMNQIEVQQQENSYYTNYNQYPAIQGAVASRSKQHAKQLSKNRNKATIGLYTKRNIVIDKPLLSSKRNHEMMNNNNATQYSRPTLNDDLTSTKSPLHPKNIEESDEETQPPQVQIQPTDSPGVKSPVEDSKNTSALRESLSDEIQPPLPPENQYPTGDYTDQAQNSEEQVIVYQDKGDFSILKILDEDGNERASGFPKPEKYNR